jgi:exopolysaccharide biosynthesis polyprenyl glycosylphosphotransferase
MIRRHMTALRVALMSVDALAAFSLFLAISVARFGGDWLGAWQRAGVDPWAAAALYAAAWVALLWIFGLYRLRTRWRVRTEVWDILRAAVLLGLATFGVLFLLKLPDVSRLFLLYLFVLQVVLTVGSRFVIRAMIRALRARGHITRYMLVVGTGKPAREFADRIERHRELGIRIIGHLATRAAPPRPTKLGRRPILGSLDDIETILHEHVVDEVAISLPADELHLLEPVTRLCEEEGKIVRIPLADHALTLPGGRIEEFDGMEVLSLAYGPDRAVGLVVKRVTDIVLGSLALLLLTPLFLVVSLAILIVDGRPVLFRQTRVGLQGRPFQVVKFRSMVPDAEERLIELAPLNEISGHAFKLTNDPRMTRTGRFLRSTSIDELPQLWNVLRGEMSLVGPRPPLPREVANYDVWHRRRLSMKPGITGLWQVAARREEDFDRWVELDLAYIDRWSVWLDLQIILRTSPALIQGR